MAAKKFPQKKGSGSKGSNSGNRRSGKNGGKLMKPFGKSKSGRRRRK